jgi:hypothetical protein
MSKICFHHDLGENHIESTLLSQEGSKSEPDERKWKELPNCRRQEEAIR